MNRRPVGTANGGSNPRALKAGGVCSFDPLHSIPINSAKVVKNTKKIGHTRGVVWPFPTTNELRLATMPDSAAMFFVLNNIMPMMEMAHKNCGAWIQI